MGKWFLILFSLIWPVSIVGQTTKYQFTKADSLRGTLSAERSCYDVTFYKLDIEVKPQSKMIEGSCEINFQALQDFDKLQLDLFQNMHVKKILFGKKSVKYKRVGNAIFVMFKEKVIKGSSGQITVIYNGKPIEARKPPWDGGFIWKKDKNGKDWVAVACEGIGASLWWPNKDHLSDEPDSMRMIYTVPKGLFCVSNGQLTEVKDVSDEHTRYSWLVTYPINNYNVTLNIGDYNHVKDHYIYNNDTLDLDYYLLNYDVKDALTHFEQVKGMLDCFNKYFGRYPFWNDGYALVETPYWGMEHQGAIAYGNELHDNGWGFDFIIIHESAHEWWGNSVSCSDHAEMWIHEAFATYSEAIYIEHFQGYKQSIAYLNNQKRMIMNQEPILGPKGVNYNQWKGADMYYKGAWMLHTIRNIIADDSLWFSILYDLANEKGISVTTTDEIIDFFNKKSGINLSNVFNHYLKYSQIPRFQYEFIHMGNTLTVRYKWVTTFKNFDMPLKVTTSKNKFEFIYPTTEWKEMILDDMGPMDFKVAEDYFYIK